jgi:hypothetical protein
VLVTDRLELRSGSKIGHCQPYSAVVYSRAEPCKGFYLTRRWIAQDVPESTAFRFLREKRAADDTQNIQEVLPWLLSQ